MMKSLNKTTIVLGIAIASMVVASVVYIFFFLSMKSKTEAATELSAQLEDLSGKQQRYTTAASSLQSESARIEKLSSYFIKESEIVSFTKKIEALGPDAGVALSLEALDPGVTEAGVPLLNFRIVARGRFENTERFLLLLQNFPGKFEWRTVNLVRDNGKLGEMSTSSPQMGTQKWRAEVSLAAYNFIKE